MEDRNALEALPVTLEDLWLARAKQRVPSSGDATAEFVPDCLLPALELVLQRRNEAFP
jgi:hypothetical protein